MSIAEKLETSIEVIYEPTAAAPNPLQSLQGNPLFSMLAETLSGGGGGLGGGLGGQNNIFSMFGQGGNNPFSVLQELQKQQQAPMSTEDLEKLVDEFENSESNL